MYINGELYKEGQSVEGIDPEVFTFERKERSTNNFGKVGGECIGTSLVNEIVNDAGKCSRYLEIGTFDGILLSILAEKYPNKEFHAVDAFASGKNTGPGCLCYFLRNCQKFDNVYLYYGKSVDVLKDVPGKFELIFIDGDHDYDSVKYDMFYCYENLLRNGGTMKMHDATMEGVRRAMKELCEKYNLELNKERWICKSVRKS
jgi:predicted O-methyltransferase YrrM